MPYQMKQWKHDSILKVYNGNQWMLPLHLFRVEKKYNGMLFPLHIFGVEKIKIEGKYGLVV